MQTATKNIAGHGYVGNWFHNPMMDTGKALYKDAPEPMLTVGDENRAIRMVPGAFRNSSEHYVAVGRHLPPSGDCVEALMAHFETRYLLVPTGPDVREPQNRRLEIILQ